MAEVTLPNHDDYRQYYYGCVCYLRGKLIKLHTLESGTALHYYELSGKFNPHDRTDLVQSACVDTLLNVFEGKSSFIPQYGYIPTTEKSVAYVALKPAKQFMRDWAYTRVQVWVPNTAETGSYGLSDYDFIALPIILRDNVTFSVPTALDKLYSGEVLGVPLSLDYALVSTYTHKEACLFRKNKMVGTVSADGFFRPTLRVFNNLPNLPYGIKRVSL